MATILVVEDEEAFRLMLTEMLKREGHSVMTAANGREAIALAQCNAFDLVITDLIMPEKEGIETILDLRKIAPGVRIIAMSGGGRGSARDYLHAAAQLGASQTLSKPFSRSQLLDAIAAALG